MLLKVLRIAVVLAAVLAAWNLTLGDSDQACAAGRNRTAPNLFYNYYVPPGPGVGAQLYLAPRPTPPLVGHTYVTYQPLMPHEFLHQHCRIYWRQHPKGRSTRTMVIWD